MNPNARLSIDFIRIVHMNVGMSFDFNWFKHNRIHSISIWIWTLPNHAIFFVILKYPQKCDRMEKKKLSFKMKIKIAPKNFSIAIKNEIRINDSMSWSVWKKVSENAFL